MALNIQPDDSRDSAPADLMANYSDQQVMTEYNSPTVWMSGIRHWLMDKLRVGLSTNVRNMDGLDTRWAADIVLPEGANFGNPEQAYLIQDVTCNRTWFYDKGKPIFILDAPDGTPFIMQSYCQIIDPNLTYEQLPTLGEKLKLPAGWKYRTKTLDQNLTVNGIQPGNKWRVTQDELRNTYSACWESGGQKSCNYQP